SYFNTTNPTAFAMQDNDSRSLDKGHNVKAGIDYYVAQKSVLSFSGGFNIRENNRSEDLAINQFDLSLKPLQLSNRTNINNGSGNSYDLNLDFSQKFANPKEELTVNLGLSEGQNDNIQSYGTNVFNINGNPVSSLPAIQRTNGTGSNKNYNFQVDYAVPFGKTGKIEAGLRSQNRISDNNTYADQFNQTSSQFDFNYLLSNDFNSTDRVHAAYFNFQNQIKNFGYQFGLRAEDASLTTNLGTYNVNSNLSYTPGKVAYRRIYPSVFLTQKLNGNQQLQLSYSRRVNRPRGWDTNPFLDVSDPLNYRQGNANLKAEDVHAFELGYSKYWKKFSLISSLYLRQTNDVIQRIRTEPDANGITISTPQNLTRNTASGVELIGKYDVVKAWNFTANVNLYQSKIQGVPAFGIVDNSGFSWNANLTNNFVLPLGITLQVKGEYRAAEVMAQGKRNAMYGMDAGAKYDLPNKKSSLSLNIRDVFATRRWKMTTTGNTSTVDFSRQMQGTMANLTYSYRFGKTAFGFKKTKKQDDQGGRPDEESF
ncbi:MAG TPA: outer membrane beta-barrel family protein, partial [Pedobacter sp.]|nr:outer membrane beta-barrel family protein [Pedobacter sp.]